MESTSGFFGSARRAARLACQPVQGPCRFVESNGVCVRMKGWDQTASKRPPVFRLHDAVASALERR